MARYISEFCLSQPFEATCNAIAQILNKAGYEFVDYEYDDLFKKGNGIMSSPEIFKLTLDENGNLKIEAWRKSCVGVGVLCGEYGPNRQMKKLITEIESLITENDDECTKEGKTVKKVAAKREYPAVEAPFKKKDFLKNHLAPSLKKEYNASAISVYVLSAVVALIGYLAENNIYMWFAIAVGVIMILAQYTKSTWLMRLTAVLGIIPGIRCAEIIYYLFRMYELINFKLETSMLIVMVLSAILMMMWLVTAAAMFVTAHKVDVHYSKIKRGLKNCEN